MYLQTCSHREIRMPVATYSFIVLICHKRTKNSFLSDISKMQLDFYNIIKYRYKFKQIIHNKSFVIRTSRIWNCLVDELDLSSSTLASFKSVIFNYYKSALAVSYDCEDPRSFKSICLKCNSARPLSRPITCCM